jgi:hypothetical protein
MNLYFITTKCGKEQYVLAKTVATAVELAEKQFYGNTKKPGFVDEQKPIKISGITYLHNFVKETTNDIPN